MFKRILRYKNNDRNVRDTRTRTLYKVFSLFCAIILWVYVLNAGPLEIDREFELVVYPPSGFAVGNQIADTVKVRMTGSRTFVMSYISSGISSGMASNSLKENQHDNQNENQEGSQEGSQEDKIVIDLRNGDYKEGKFDLDIDINSLNLPIGIEVMQISPNRVSLELQKEIKKKVPVRPHYFGELPDDLKLMMGEIKPSSIMISGPLEVMRRTTMLRAGPIDRQMLAGVGSIPVAIVDLDKRIKNLNEGPIEFFYEVRPKKANLVLKNIPIKFLSSNLKITSRVKNVSLDVLASEGMKFQENEIQVIAEIPEEASGVFDVKLKAHLPDGVHLMAIHPDTIRLGVKK